MPAPSTLTRFRIFCAALAVTCVAPRAGAQIGAQPLIQCGETHGRLVVGGVPDALAFQAASGEVVSITAVAVPDVAGSLPALRWAVNGPDGKRVSTSTGAPDCAGQCETAPLPASGTYTLIAFDPDNAGTGAYNVTLEAVSATANGIPNGPPTPTCARQFLGIPDGTRPLDRRDILSGIVNALGETDTFTFVAKTGEVLNLKTMSATIDADPRFAPQWELFDPKGQRVPTAGDQPRCAQACDTRSLPMDGVYTAEVSDAGHDRTGPYTIRLRTVEPTTTTTTSTTTTSSSTTTTGAPTSTTAASTTTTTSTLPPMCGNGAVEEGEACDGSAGGALCPDSAAGGVVTCSPGCTLDYTACLPVTTTSTTDTTSTTTIGETTTTTTDVSITTTTDASTTTTTGAPITTTTDTSATTTTDPSSTTTTTDASTTTTTTDPSTTTAAVTTTTTATLPEPSTTSTTVVPTTTLGTPVEPPLPFELGLTLRGAGASPGDASALGAATAVHGDRLLLGAPHDATAAPDAGAVLVVNLAGNPEDPGFGARLETLIKPGTPAAGDLFGASVADAAGGVLVGAPGDGDAGAAYFFADDGQTTPLLPPTPLPVRNPRFGAAVAGVGAALAVGAPGADAVYVYGAAGGMSIYSVDSPAVAGGQFGAALAASGGSLLVGAPGNAQRPGQAFVVDAATGAVVRELVSPTSAPGDEFGGAVAIDGSTLVIGAPGVGAGQVLVFDAATGTLLHTLADATPGSGARFGAALAITPAGVLVGAPADDAQAPTAGAAFLFDATSGALVNELRRPDPQPGAAFGTSVLAVGMRFLIGAAHDDVGRVGGGAAYLFGAMGPEAVFRSRLSGSGYGTAVAAVGTDLIVGAPRGGSGTGAVQRLDGATGAVLVTIDGPAGANGFGFAVAAAGDLVVAAPDAGSGMAYLFDGTTLAGELANPEPADGDQFGFAIAGDGRTVAVGAPLASGLDTGRVDLFDPRTGQRLLTLQKPTPSTGDFFGASVALLDDKVLVGAPFDGSAGASTGAAYLFDANTAVLLRPFQSPAPQAGDMFGASVAISHDRVAVGAPMAAGAGRVYLFERATGNLLRTLESPAPHTGDQFGKMVALTEERVSVGAPSADGSNADTGAAYVFDVATGTLLESFLDPAQGRFDHFGAALVPTPNGLLVGAPGASRVYFFAGSAPAPAPVARSAARALRPLLQAQSAAVCGNGIVESGETCDDGNQSDWDDCRNDCQGTRCCTVDPQDAVARCDDGNPCTTDAFDPDTGCSNTPNGTCCDADTPCVGGTCRVCAGCSFFPWDCCATGSVCLERSPECVGTECLAGAYCECGGGLACADQTVPDRVGTLFSAGCDRLRLEASVVPDTTDPTRLRTARATARTARKMMQKAVKTTRKLTAHRDVSRACARELLAKIKMVKQSIPKSRELRRCVLGQ